MYVLFFSPRLGIVDCKRLVVDAWNGNECTQIRIG